MQKVYLKYNEDVVAEECPCGFAKGILCLGFLYPLIKKNFKFFLIILSLQASTTALILIFVKPLSIAIITSLCLIVLTNLLFAANYNMIVLEDYLKKGYTPYDYDSSNLLLKKGIYFKLQ